MEQLPPLGRVIPQVIGQTSEIYASLLAKNSKAEILGTVRETHSYGPHKRQQLDLYTANDNAEARPLLIFLYGGGFVNGDKVLSRIPDGLAYTNLGYYFSQKAGFDTVIPDYRLNGNGGAFPSGGEDIAAVLDWVRQRYGGQQQTKDVYLLGNSAGGVHLATWLLADQFRSSREQFVGAMGGVRVAGAITLGALMKFTGAPPPLASVLRDHYGGDLETLSPLALLKKTRHQAWPRLLVLYSELDPEDIIQSNVEFLSELKTMGLTNVDHFVLKGHNHISPPLALGTGIAREEEWGGKVVAWCTKSS